MTLLSSRDTFDIAGVAVNRRAEEHDRDRAFKVSSIDDPVVSSLSFDAGIRDFCLPQVEGRRGGSCVRLIDPAVAGFG